MPFLVLVATVPLWLRRRAEAQGREILGRGGEYSADLVDAVQGMREVVAFGAQRLQLARIDRNAGALAAARLAHGRRAGFEKAATHGLVSLGMLAVVGARNRGNFNVQKGVGVRDDFVRLALLDLDGTLVDRDTGFHLWARRFVEDEADAGTLDWLEENDRAVKERGRFLALVREHFGTDRGTDALWNDYRDQMQRPVPMEPVRSWSDVSC